MRCLSPRRSVGVPTRLSLLPHPSLLLLVLLTALPRLSSAGLNFPSLGNLRHARLASHASPHSHKASTAPSRGAASVSGLQQPATSQSAAADGALADVALMQDEERRLASAVRVAASATDGPSQEHQDDPVMDLGMPAVCSQGAASGTARAWPGVRVSSRAGPTRFGYLLTEGRGVLKADWGVRSCFTMAARTPEGDSFDLGQRQNALFAVRLTAASAADDKMALKMQADVAYIPSASAHCVCYNAPAPGTYKLQVLMVYVNAGQLLGCTSDVQGAGRQFTNYTPVLSTQVQVLYEGRQEQFQGLRKYRQELPLCTAEALARSRNAGFWYGQSWFPSACRLTRLSPGRALQCLDKQRVLVMGDSQSRILLGVLQAYLGSPSRDSFLRSLGPYFLGDFLGDKQVLRATTWGGTGPPVNGSSGLADKVPFAFLRNTCSYLGGVYQGFASCRIKTRVRGSARPVSFNLTYSSSFLSARPVFDSWKLNGGLTQGASVLSNGFPFDMVLQANQIHDVNDFANAGDYAASLRRRWLPDMRNALRNVKRYIMFGSLSMVESRNPAGVCGLSAVRRQAFNAAAQQVTASVGFPNFLSMEPVTWPRSDLAYDSIHYTWPVSLAMVDLWLGTACPAADAAN